MRREDRAVVARDPAIPGLALALDDEALGAWLRRSWSGDDDLATVRTTYLRYKPATAIIAGLELTTAKGVVLTAAARFVASDGADKLHKAAAPAPAGAQFGAVLDLGTLGVVVPAVADRHLPGVRRLLRDDRRDRVRVLRYKPERRLVARVGKRRLVKAHRPDRGRAAAQAHAALSAAGMPVPSLLGSDRRRGLVATRWVDGQVVAATTFDADLVARCGEAAATLHAHRIGSGLPAAQPVADDLADAADAIAAVAPEHGREAAHLAQVVGRLVGAPVASTAVHGDLSADQLLLTDDGAIMLLDVDSAHCGDPAGDIGSFVAAGLVHGQADALGAAAVIGGLLEGVARVTGDDHAAALGRRVEAHVAAGLLRRAVEPFRTRVPGWSAEAERILTLARHHGDRAVGRLVSR